MKKLGRESLFDYINTNIDVLKAIIEIIHFLSFLYCAFHYFAYNESETLVQVMYVPHAYPSCIRNTC